MTTEAQVNKLLEQGEAVYRLLDGDCRITLLSVFVLTRNQAYRDRNLHYAYPAMR